MDSTTIKIVIEAVDRASEVVAQINDRLAGMFRSVASGALDLARGALDTLVDGLRTVVDISEKAGLAVGGLLAAFTALGLHANASKQFNILSLESLTKSKDEAKDLYDYMDQLSDVWHMQNEQMIDAGRKLRAFGFDVKENLGMVAGMAAVMGVGADQVIRVMNQAQNGLFNSRIYGQIGVNRKALEEQGVEFTAGGKASNPDDLLPALKKVMQDRTGRIQEEMGQTLTAGVTTTISNIRRTALAATETLATDITAALHKVNELFTSILRTPAGASIVNALRVPFDLLGKAIEMAAEHLPQFLEWLSKIATRENVVNLIAQIAGWIQALAQEVGKFFQAAGSGKEGWAGIWETFANAARTAIDFVLKLWNGLVTAIQYFAQNGDKVWKAIGEGIDFVKASLEVLVGVFVVGIGVQAVAAVGRLISALAPLGGMLGKAAGAIGLGPLAAGAAGLGVGAAIEGGASGDNAHDIAKRLLSDIGAGAATGGAAGLLGAGIGAVPGAIIGGGIGAVVGGASEIYRYLTSRGVPHEKAAAAAAAAGGGGGDGFHFGGVLGGLQGIGAAAIGDVGGAAGGIGDFFKKNFPAIGDVAGGGIDAFKRGFAGGGLDQLTGRANENAATIRNAINGMIGPGKSGSALPPRHDFGAEGAGSGEGAGGGEREDNFDDLLKAHHAFLEAEIERVKATLATMPEQQRAASEAAQMAPLLRQQQDEVNAKLARLDPQSKEYWDAVKEGWKTEAQIAAFEDKAVKEREKLVKEAQKATSELHHAQFDATESMLRSVIGALPETQRAAAEVAGMIPILKARQAQIAADARELLPGTKEYWQKASEFYRVQEQVQQLNDRGIKDQANQAKQLVDARIGLAEAQMKNMVGLSEAEKQQAMAPLLLQKLRELSRPVNGESEIEKLQRLTSAEGVKGSLMDAFHVRDHQAQLLGGGSISLVDRRRLFALSQAMQAAQASGEGDTIGGSAGGDSGGHSDPGFAGMPRVVGKMVGGRMVRPVNNTQIVLNLPEGMNAQQIAQAVQEQIERAVNGAVAGSSD